MRDEITEPQHWRARSEQANPRNNSWAARRRSQQEELPVDAVDAALEQTVSEPEPKQTLNSADVISSLTQHLKQLEEQSEKIQRLLEQAQGL